MIKWMMVLVNIRGPFLPASSSLAKWFHMHSYKPQATEVNSPDLGITRTIFRTQFYHSIAV
jgi:hypothetical protein